MLLTGPPPCTQKEAVDETQVYLQSPWLQLGNDARDCLKEMKARGALWRWWRRGWQGRKEMRVTGKRELRLWRCEVKEGR